MEYYGISGHGDLLRNAKTNSIVNTNSTDYEKYVTRRDVKKAQSEQVNSIEEDLANLKSEMSEIKSLLKELVSNVN